MTQKGIKSTIIVCFASLILLAIVWYLIGWWVALAIWGGSFVAVSVGMAMAEVKATTKSKREVSGKRSALGGEW